MATGSTGAPWNLPFPVGADNYALTGDLQAMASQTAAQLGNLQQVAETAHWRGVLPAGTDLNTVTQIGQYAITSLTHPNQPFVAGGYLEVLDNGSGRRLQRFTTNETTPRHAERVTAITGFNPWQYTEAEAQGAYEHMARQSDMIRRRRNRVTTPGAVVLIFDHGLTNFKATIWPLLEARNLPVTLAMNPGRMLSHATNNGATYNDVKAWAATGLVEPANHSYNHVNSTDYAYEIRDSRIELEAQLGQTIDTWVMPGNSYGDFEINSDPDQYWSTDAGRMILASHGAVTGIVADQTLPIGGNQIGVGGTWIDTAGRTTTMRTDITNAVNAGGMKIVRHHPEYLNATGYINTAELTAFLDWLVQRRDAGDLTVLTFRDAMSATHEPAAATWSAAITALNAAAA